MDSHKNKPINDEWKKDDFTLRVKGGDYNSPDESKRPTDPERLSRSLLHVLDNNPEQYVKLLSVGPVAERIATRAYRIAAKEVKCRTDGAVLVMTQSEYIADISGWRTEGICTRIYPINQIHTR